MHIIVLRQSSQKSLRECVIGNSIRIPYTFGRFSKWRETSKPKMIPHPACNKQRFLSSLAKCLPRFFMVQKSPYSFCHWISQIGFAAPTADEASDVVPYTARIRYITLGRGLKWQVASKTIFEAELYL